SAGEPERRARLAGQVDVVALLGRLELAVVALVAAREVERTGVRAGERSTVVALRRAGVGRSRDRAIALLTGVEHAVAARGRDARDLCALLKRVAGTVADDRDRERRF